MELPSWIKIDSLVKKIEVSNFLRDFFKGGINLNINITKQYYYNDIKIPRDERIVARSELITDNTTSVFDDEKSFEFSEDQKILIKCINEIHTLNNSLYDFASDYKSALICIKSKPEHWTFTSSIFMRNAIPDGGIRNIFKHIEIDNNPEEKERIDLFRKDLQSSFEYINSLGHANKKKNNNNEEKETEVNEEEAERYLNRFQEILLYIFKGYNIKK